MTDTCGMPHPTRPDVTCDKVSPCWVFHSSAAHPDVAAWAGNPIPRKTVSKAVPAQMAQRAAQGARTGPPSLFARTSDPRNSHTAAALYEPKRESAKGRVLAYLREHLGEWIDAPELATHEVGGFGGTRRMRELRDDGWPIETRPKPGEPNTWQHRLINSFEVPLR